MDSPTYVLDANVFIEAARRYYAPDLAPAFWDGLISHAENGLVLSVDRVLVELEKGKDWLAGWSTNDFSHGFVSTDDENIIKAYSNIIRWVESQDRFFDGAKSDFAKGADGWLVAYALANGCIVVTHEQPAPEARNKVPIPEVCLAFSVQFIDTFEMLRKLGVRF